MSLWGHGPTAREQAILDMHDAKAAAAASGDLDMAEINRVMGWD